jgi:hypothetical protein
MPYAPEILFASVNFRETASDFIEEINGRKKTGVQEFRS